jgi:hypothetical protein
MRHEHKRRFVILPPRRIHGLNGCRIVVDEIDIEEDVAAWAVHERRRRGEHTFDFARVTAIDAVDFHGLPSQLLAPLECNERAAGACHRVRDCTQNESQIPCRVQDPTTMKRPAGPEKKRPTAIHVNKVGD